jgi:hypothetical protein
LFCLRAVQYVVGDLNQIGSEKEATMQITTSWMEEGVEKGLRLGKEEMVLRLLQKRVGALPTATQRRVQRLSVSQLTELGDALLDFTGPDDLTNWLNRTTPE